MEKFWNVDNYLAPTRYISGRIVEYDIKAANISIMRQKGVISEEDYNDLMIMPKQIREREVGLMEKNDPKLYTLIHEGILEAKGNLASFNGLKQEDVVRIANDAVYVNSPIDLKYTKFGEFVEFKQKSDYNSYLNLNGVIVLIKFLPNGDIHTDVKNIGNNVELHKNFMVYAIVSAIVILERSGIDDAIAYVSNLCERYLKKELSIEYYREFNPASMYKSLYRGFDGSGYSMFSVREQYKNDIDGTFNYNILRELWSILLEIYTLKRR